MGGLVLFLMAPLVTLYRITRRKKLRTFEENPAQPKRERKLGWEKRPALRGRCGGARFFRN
jgi:hypothetical protein